MKHPIYRNDTDTSINARRNFIRDLLPDMSQEEISMLISVLPMEQVCIATAPHTGLIMAQVCDCFGVNFYLGEVLVTRAEVTYRDYRAQATLMGDKPEAALVAAVLDALAFASEAEILKRAEVACSAARKRIESSYARESELMAATRVTFDSMAEEK